MIGRLSGMFDFLDNPSPNDGFDPISGYFPTDSYSNPPIDNGSYQTIQFPQYNTESGGSANFFPFLNTQVENMGSDRATGSGSATIPLSKLGTRISPYTNASIQSGIQYGIQRFEQGPVVNSLQDVGSWIQKNLVLVIAGVGVLALATSGRSGRR